MNNRALTLRTPSLSGRMTVEKDKPGKFVVDLKGRQYIGDVFSGPVVMILNLTAPVAAKARATKKEDNNKGVVDEDGDASSVVKAKEDKAKDDNDNDKDKDKEVAGQVARVEVVTNEFCQLEFQQDMLANLKGEYKGEMDREELQEGDTEKLLRKNAPKISTVVTKKRGGAKKKTATKRAKTK